jgi:hypothetical protein
VQDRADKQATLSNIVCNIQTIGEKRGQRMDRFDAMRAFARVVEAAVSQGCPNASYEQNHGDKLIQQLEARPAC